MAPGMIERTSPTPYYEQLFTILSARISNGTIPADSRLPSEHELCEEFGLSRATVRQTLSKLESEGFARRIPRRGVFATAPGAASTWVIQDVEGFLDSQLRHGRRGVTTQVVEAGQVIPPERVRLALGIDEGETVFAVERVRRLNGAPALSSTNWLPGAAGEAIAAASPVLDGRSSLNAALAASGHVIARARRVIHALPSPEKEAHRLDIAIGHPLLRISSTSWDRNHTPVDYYETWALTDTVPLEINIGAQ